MPRQRVFGYLRVSTDEQAQHGNGLDVQEAKIREYCRTNGLRLVEIFRDEGISGSNGLDSRRGLATALARIEAGEASALVVAKLDRLARNLELQETTVRILQSTGASVLSASEPATNSDQPESVLMRQMLGVVSQYERTLIRGRMMAGRQAKMAAGGYGGGHTPYGTTVRNGELVADDGEAQTVGKVTTLRATGHSYRQICAALTEAGLTTRSGTDFTPMQVRRIAQRAGVA
jgi:DNA invertase Pin-like site-specific DNA recombinase